MSQVIGQSLDRYQITALLGRGGMGSVYRAHDLTLRRDVALKVMHAHLAEVPEFKARFVQEARAAANLDHEGIVKVYDFKQSGEVMYIVMEYIAGGNLKQMLQHMRDSHRWLMLSDTTALVQQLAMALDYAHRRGVLHRDIKPANIMLKPDAVDAERQRPVITDMGLAKLAESSVVTQTGESMGTPAYMAPEQALGKQVGPGVDIYALGVVLYELVVGELPFTAKTLSEAFQVHNKRTPPPSPTKRRPDVPADLEWVILKALEFEPAQRFATARELGDALTDATIVTTIATVPAVATRGALGLGTLYKESLSEPPSASPLKQGDETEHPASEPVLNVQIIEPGGAARIVEVKASKISIGREPDNLIQLMEDQKVSRHHAQITLDGNIYKIVDLNSTNGTYLGDSRLLPAVPEPWLPNKPLKLGSHILYLQQRSSHQGELPARFPVTVGVRDQETRPTESVVLRLPTNQIRVDPGGTVELIASIRNVSPTVGHFLLALTGVPSEWVVPPPPIHLMPGAQEEATITIRPPHDPTARAGSRVIGLSVRRKGADTDLAVQQVTLTVTQFAQLGLTVDPQRKRSDEPGDYRVSVSNGGNCDLQVMLNAQDDANECEFTLEPTQVHVPAGETRHVKLSVQRRAAVADFVRTYAFSVNAQSLYLPDVRAALRGEWVCSPPLPSFEIVLQPKRQTRSEYGDFSLELTNSSQVTTTIWLVGYDEQIQCIYTFDPAQVTLGAGQKRVVGLKVRSAGIMPTGTTRTHQFTVSAASAGSPNNTKQVTGEWVQLAGSSMPQSVPSTSNPGRAEVEKNATLTPSAPLVRTGLWFWLRWVVLSAAMWSALWILLSAFSPYDDVFGSGMLINVSAFGAVLGLIGGFLQWLMLRARIKAAWRWIPMSVIAWSLGLALSALFLDFIPTGILEATTFLALNLLLGIVVLSLLRPGVGKLSVSYFSWVIGTSTVVAAIGLLVSQLPKDSDAWFLYLIAPCGLVFGGMTGGVLVSAIRDSGA